VVSAVDSLTLSVNLNTSLAVKFGQSVKIDLGLLDDLDLADVAVLNGVDWLGSFYNLSSNAVGKELGNEFLDVSVRDLSNDELGHLLSDLFDLLALGVGGLFDLFLAGLFGEGGDENAQVVVVCGFDVDLAFDHCLPFLDHGADLVAGELHTVEVEDAVLALDIFADELELSVAGSVLLEVGLVAVKDSSLEAVGGDLVTDGSGDEGLADLSDLKHTWGLDVIPVLFGEWIDNLLLTSLFTSFGHTLVLPYRHDESVFFWFFFICKFDLRL